MKTLRLFALALIVALALPARADVILTFGQNLRGDTIVATDDGTTTEITGTDIAITVTEIEANSPAVPFQALLNLDAISTGPAQVGPLGVVEPFDGTFSITSALCGAGNCLSGVFSGATFGFLGGASLTMSSAMPPGALTFTSDVITELGLPRGLSFSFANVNPPVSVDGTTIAAFDSSVSGTFSAALVPEPGTLALMGLGLLGLAYVGQRKGNRT
jgi:hypothetical protein